MKTEIISVIDTSGSMGTIALEASQGYNEFIRDQAEVPGEARVSLTTFGSAVCACYSGLPISEAPKFRLNASGMTAMFDGIGQAMTREGERIAREGWADKVIVCILTDGQENHSREYNAAHIRTMVRHAEAHGWSFVFLAANQDAFQAGANIGVSAQHTYAFAADSVGTTQAYQTMSTATRSLRGTTI